LGVRYPDRRGRREALARELVAILERIVDADTERVILFGSAARGDVRTTSDLDLLVVRRDARRPADLYRRAQPTVALDLLAYTPEELEAARESRYPNGLPGGIPADAHGRADGERALGLCRMGIDLVAEKSAPRA
jgi:predicted nucleotidyltransferase